MHYQNKLSNSYSLPHHTHTKNNPLPTPLKSVFAISHQKNKSTITFPWYFFVPKCCIPPQTFSSKTQWNSLPITPHSPQLFSHPKEMSKKLLVTKKSPQQTVTQILANTFKVNYNKWEVIFYSMAYFPITYYSPQGLGLCTVPCLRAILYLVF